jgi:DNA polymerase
MGIDSKTKSWVRRTTYGGSLVESICQAMAGCLLQAICERSEKAGYPVVFTVHDEIVAEVPQHYPLEPFHQLVKVRPSWCSDLPIECESHETVRYGK